MKITKNRALTLGICFAFVALLVCSSLVMFTNTTTANAASVTSTFKTQNFFDVSPLYNGYGTENDWDNISTWSNAYSNWYLTIQIDTITTITYGYIDINNSSANGYVESYLEYRNVDDLSTLESHFTIRTSSTSNRVLDYVLIFEQFEQEQMTYTSIPTYMSVAYSPLGTNQYNFTAKRVDEPVNSYVLANYTFGNTEYRLTFIFPVKVTRYAYNDITNGSNTYNYTMYYSADQQENSVFQAGYEQGKRDTMNKVYTNSESYKQGVIDGASENNPYNFLNFFAGIADAQLKLIDGFLDFDFLGFNMLTLFKVILTLGICYGVFRLIKGS